MSDSYTIDQESLASAVTFLEQFLVSKLPNYDFSAGTANRDIAINSIALVFAVIRNDIEAIKSRLTLNDLKDKTDDTSNEIVDDILSDIFVTRHTGDYGTGEVTLYFSSNQSVTLQITNDHIFIKDGVEFTLSTESTVITAGSLKQNVDAYGKTYYTTTLNLIAKEKGPTGKAKVGVFSSWNVSSPYLYKVEVLEEFSGGEAAETSSDLVIRSEKALTVKNLVTHNAIYTVLTEKFLFLKNVVPIGMNEPEMTRDLLPVTVGNTVMNIHRGSMIDIYCKFPIVFRNSVSGTLTEITINSTDYIAMQLPAVPIYKIRSVEDTANNNTKLDFSVVIEDKNLFLSAQQKIYVVVSGTEYKDRAVRVTYDYTSNYDEVQAFVATSTERTVVANSLVKAQFALYLSFDMVVYANADIDESAMLATLQEYIHSSEVTPSNLYVASIVRKMSTVYGVTVQMPLAIKGTILLANGSTMEITFKDRINVPPKYMITTDTVPQYLPLFEGDANPNGYQVGSMTDLQVSNSTTRVVMDTSESTIKRA